ncbi:hypothetical protein OPT61_g3599 [Boeremia exigua]|uniref:Uncharacterized protein n=1 Tax=Boeremia exigua TaxID=749465 RepID=A0ACC2IH72_9PLEO|nr:hypothetical protein OPT61_g3599 [Boeremia exigua]
MKQAVPTMFDKDVKDTEALAPISTSRSGEVEDTSQAVMHDAVFGDITEDGPNYRNVGWLGTSALMMKTQIGLGVLSIPAAFNTLGLVPGVLCLLAIGGITTWSNYMVGIFKLNHPEVYGIDDAGRLMFGRIGREVLGLGFILYEVFAIGSGMLGVSIGLNAVSSHGACTVVFVTVAAIVVFCFAIFVVTIGVGVEDRPGDAPQFGPWEPDYKIIGQPTFAEAISAVATFVFAYAGTPVFFPIAAEMRQPRHYAKALILCQTVVTVVYVTVGVVVYYYCGSYVASPALGSAGKLIKQIGYGIALPGLVVSATLNTHVISKYLFVRILRGFRHLTSNTFVHWATWLGCVFTIAVVAYCIASGIPSFGALVSLVGALLGTLQCFQPMGCMWLYDNWSTSKEQRNLRWKAMVGWSAFVIISGTFLMIGGTYGAVLGVIDSYKTKGGSPWSCADNSNSH